MRTHILVLIGVSFLFEASGNSQVHRDLSTSSVMGGKASLDGLPAFDLRQSPDIQAQARSARASHYNTSSHRRLYNQATGAYSINTRTMSGIPPNPLPLDSSLIVEGYVSSAHTHLSADGTMLYTTFTLTPSRILKGRDSASEITFDRIGGVALLPNGKKAFVGDQTLGLPDPGHNYLLFLNATGEPGIFEVNTGYAIQKDRLLALDQVNDRVDGTALTEAVRSIVSSH